MQITCLVQKEFEKAARSEKRISNIIVMEKLGDYSFKFSLRALIQIRKNIYDLAIVMDRAGNKTRDRRTHILTSFIKSRQKIISVSDGSFREFQLSIPLGNLLEVLLANMLSLADLILAKLTHLLSIPLLSILKLLKQREMASKNK